LLAAVGGAISCSNL